jgi:MoaA/NifB/PqqE/SkfB family radical SAM enzyme
MTSSIEFNTPSPFHPDKLALHHDKVVALASGEIIAPQTIEVDVTDGFCNQACSFCCFGSGPYKKLNRIDPDVLNSALTDAYNLGTRAVELVGGGEPTTHPQISEIIKGITEIGSGDMEVGIITNGVLASRLLTVADKLTFIRVSLDSANATTYKILHGAKKSHFETVIRNIQKLRGVIKSKAGERKLGIAHLVVPPSNHTSAEIYASAELADELGVDYIVYRPAELNEIKLHEEWQEAQFAIASVRKKLEAKNSHTAVFGGSGNRWDTLTIKTHPKGTCSAKPLVAVIQANGDLAFCILNRNNRNMRLGNIYEGSFAEQWFSNEHLHAWRNFPIDNCPNPCKFYRYNEIVDAQVAGVPVKAPKPKNVLHHGFV